MGRPEPSGSQRPSPTGSFGGSEESLEDLVKRNRHLQTPVYIMTEDPERGTVESLRPGGQVIPEAVERFKAAWRRKRPVPQAEFAEDVPTGVLLEFDCVRCGGRFKLKHLHHELGETLDVCEECGEELIREEHEGKEET